MPRNTIVAKRYVRALIDSRGGTRGLDACISELRAIWGSISSNPEIKEFFLSPIVSRETKKEALASLKDSMKESYEFLNTLIEADRLDSLPEIVEVLISTIEESLGEMSVRVEFARAPTEGSLDEIRAVLQDRWRRKIKMTTEINPKLIGGFIARGPGKILDASVVSQLDGLKQSLSSRT